MSPREETQNQIVAWLETHRDKFNAPYGIIPALNPFKNGKGKVRTVTFGQARWLDAMVYIWSPKHFTIQASGPASYRLDREYHSLNDFLTALNDL